jgi:hypothetical protein
MESFDKAKALFDRIQPLLNKFINDDIPKIENKLKKADVPLILE